MVYEAVGRLDDAVNAYTLAYGIDGKNPVIIGNLARARIRRGDDDPVVQQLLADLRLYDTRPEWLHWANDRLALGPSAAGPPPLPMTKGGDDGAWREPKLLDIVPELVSPPLPDVEQELPLMGPSNK